MLGLLTSLLLWSRSFAQEINYEELYNSLLQEYNTLSWSFVQCINTLNERNWQVSTLSWNLSTCNYDLYQCQNSADVMVSSSKEALVSCQSDKTSLQNYSDSLSFQLNECLANIPEPCIGSGCDEVATWVKAIFSFFRENEDQMFSLPIANNVFLPRWYKAYVESWVVALTRIDENSMSISDEDFTIVNKSYYVFMWSFVLLCIVALFCYYLKKFLSKFFIPKAN